MLAVSASGLQLFLWRDTGLDTLINNGGRLGGRFLYIANTHEN